MPIIFRILEQNLFATRVSQADVAETIYVSGTVNRSKIRTGYVV